MSDNRFKVRLIDGRLYDPWSPSGPVPSPETIVHGLANLCRYGGHVRRRYSVAEHSLWVALRLGSDNFARDAMMAVEGRGWLLLPRPRLALLGLVHDTPEGAGLVDVPGPVLRHDEMAPYKAAHDRCLNWLLDGWGIARPTEDEWRQVMDVDRSILGAEMAIRPRNTDNEQGSGEYLLWEGFDLAEQNYFVRTGTTWVDVFHCLKERV